MDRIGEVGDRASEGQSAGVYGGVSGPERSKECAEEDGEQC